MLLKLTKSSTADSLFIRLLSRSSSVRTRIGVTFFLNVKLTRRSRKPAEPNEKMQNKSKIIFNILL